MTDGVFNKQKGKNLVAYVDDIVVKTHVATQLIDDLEETFSNLCPNHIMLNLEKCVFGVPARKLLGFNISEHVIEINPKKISLIKDMEPIKNLKGA